MAVFKARARALDMLGRQQIAGIPTAISELFKNAHDAYADRVEVDFFRDKGLFLLRDDGLGMTRDDFEKRWLTLGTESKLNARSGLQPPPIDIPKQPRPVMGEKGIGRLAIAIIGRQVLVLTRAKRAEGERDLVAAFIHWGMFELPGVDLDQIEIPIRVFPGGTVPGRSEIASMLSEVRENLESLGDIVAPEQKQAILEDIAKVDIDPSRYDGCFLGPTLKGGGHGTHFYILPASEILEADLVPDEAEASRMAKTLLGFTNTMSPNHPTSLIATAFRDHTNPETYINILEMFEFFVPEEFFNADQRIKGCFDEYGQFQGSVTVFGTEHNDHVVMWKNPSKKKIECGPFDIEVGYIQGEPKESTLPGEDFTIISRKLDKYGGLYIYRDNIRVLPYGHNDNDWINMEKRRSQNAGYYFFSYRRIFGLINISQETNPNLFEKAGREGFRENKAYRQFRDIIINFFIQLAADFFRESGAHSEPFFKRKNDVKTTKAAEKRERDLKAAHDAFEKKLSKAFQGVEQRTPEQEAQKIINNTNDELERIILGDDPERVVSDIAQVEAAVRRRMRDLRDQYNILPPSGVGLSTELRRQWESYAGEFERLDREVFRPTMARIQEVTAAASELSKITLEPKARLRKAIDIVAEEIRDDVDTDMRAARVALRGLEERTTALLREVQSDITGTIQSAIEQIHTTEVHSLSDASKIDLRIHLEDIVIQSGERARDILQALTVQMNNMQWRRDDELGIILSIDETAALEEELLALRERTEQDLELVQLGTTIDVINHEFASTVASIRNNLRRLQVWGEANPRLGEIYKDLRASFDHLDGYLTLFTPLHRRLYRAQTQFTGSSIARYLSDLFGERLEKYEITLDVASAFHDAKIISFPSTFYPVFVNLVDNATFWLQDARPPRFIRLDVQGTDLLVSDNGPGIPLRDRDAVFKAGFSRKPGGRGLGLFISRDALSRVGWQLTLDSTAPGSGTTFRIRPTTNA